MDVFIYVLAVTFSLTILVIIGVVLRVKRLSIILTSKVINLLEVVEELISNDQRNDKISLSF